MTKLIYWISLSKFTSINQLLKMSQKKFFTSSTPIYLFVVSIFIFIISPNMFSDGMFMDGLIYSSVAQNLSEGAGTFWNPQFSSVYLQEFHEHPPLAFGIHSIFYSIFGDSRFIDKGYSLLTILITGFLLVRIWQHFKLKYGWFPLLLWLITPLVGWTATNNMLENTMMIFTTLSVYFYLKSTKEKSHFYISLAGLMLCFGFLTKGFFAFFPWTFPFIHWIILRNVPFKRIFWESVGIVAYTLLPLALLILISPEAKLSLQKYFDIQVVNSLKNVVIVDSRFFILKKLLTELIPLLGVGFLLWIIVRFKKINIRSLNEQAKYVTVFFLLGLTGVLPIMISMKQNGFYIVTTLPIFAISIALLFYPVLDSLMNPSFERSRIFPFFKWFSYGIFLLSISVAIYFSGKIGRDKDKLEDIYLIMAELEEGEIITIPASLHEDWSLHGYFSRYKNISLDLNQEIKREHLLILIGNYHDSLLLQFEKVDLSTKELMLLKRKYY